MNHKLIICIILITLVILLIVLIKLNSNEYFGTNDQLEIQRFNDLNIDNIDCNWDITDKLVGKGETSGEVFEVLCDKFPTNKFVAKVYKNVNPKKVYDEALNQLSAGFENAPEVFDAFMIGNDGYIIMEQMDDSIMNFIQKNAANLEDKLSLSYEIENKAKNKLSNTLQKGVVHDDTRYDNIMIKMLPNGDYDVYLIDWGFVQKPSVANFDKQIADKMKDLELTFKLLRSDLSYQLDKSSFTVRKQPPPINKRVKKAPSFFSEPQDRYQRQPTFDIVPQTEPKKARSLFDDEEDLNFLKRSKSMFDDEEDKF
jgi:tRNA A-37 threonylcarbamoyl transferase component Bud32